MKTYRWVGVWALFAAVPALAQLQLELPEASAVNLAATTQRPPWSSISAETVGTGNTVLNFQVGYPGISAAILAGQSEHFDFGGKFTFLYGTEASTQVVPGLRLQGILRFLVGQRGKVKFGLEFEPGIFTQFFFRAADFGVFLPLKFTVGIPVLKDLWVHAGVDLPLTFVFVPGFVGAIPILFGGGVEYLVLPDLSLTFRLRLGPSIIVPIAYVTLGVDALVGVAWRL